MSLKKFFAAIVVVGLVGAGAVSAQSVIAGDNVLPPGDPRYTGEVELSYTVLSTARMEVTAGASVADATLLRNPARTIITGTTALVEVETNYANWDVEMFIPNEGKLSATDPNTHAPIDLKCAGPGASATPGTAGDPCVLDVVVALRPVGGSGANVASFVVGKTTPAATTGHIAHKTAAHSLAGTFGVAAHTTGANGGLATAFDGRNKGDILTDGFGPTSRPIQFVVNAGLGVADASTTDAAAILANNTPTGNPDGVYTSTITFTLVAAY